MIYKSKSEWNTQTEIGKMSFLFLKKNKKSKPNQKQNKTFYNHYFPVGWHNFINKNKLLQSRRPPSVFHDAHEQE